MVRRLSRSVNLAAPSDFALAFLSTYFLERDPLANGAELPLRFPIPRLFVDGLTIEKRVSVHLMYAASANQGHRLKISWQPMGNGPLPDFEGTLSTVTQTATTSQLRMDGSYTPPGGIAGIAFDQLIGGHIATATIDALLEQFRVAIEQDYRVRSIP